MNHPLKSAKCAGKIHHSPIIIMFFCDDVAVPSIGEYIPGARGNSFRRFFANKEATRCFEALEKPDCDSYVRHAPKFRSRTVLDSSIRLSINQLLSSNFRCIKSKKIASNVRCPSLVER